MPRNRHYDLQFAAPAEPAPLEVPSWSSVMSTWRYGLTEVDTFDFRGISFTEVPTRLVSSNDDPPRLDWWPIPPWPNPTAIADRIGMGARHGPGPARTLSMLYEAANDPDAIAAILLWASLIQLRHYPPRNWESASLVFLKIGLHSAMVEAGFSRARIFWHGSVRTTLPLQLFRSEHQWVAPATVTDLVHLLSLEHVILLHRWHPVRGVPLDGLKLG